MNTSGFHFFSRIAFSIVAFVTFIIFAVTSNVALATADSIAEAIPISLGSATANARIYPAGELDYYRLELSTGGNLEVATSGTSDTIGELLNSAGNVIASNDDGGAGTNFKINRSVAAGTYYIKVRLFSRYRTGNYTLQVNCAGCTSSTGGGSTSGGTTSGGTTSGGSTSGGTTSGGTTSGGTNNTSSPFPDAQTVSVNSSQTGNINSVGESNYYRVNIGGNGGTLRASTSGSTDTYGELLNSAGNMLVANDDGGNGTNFSIIRSLSAGTYYVKVRLYSRYRIGSYTLQLNCTGCSDSSSGGTTSGGTTSGGSTSGGTTSGGSTSGGTTSGGTTSGGTNNTSSPFPDAQTVSVNSSQTGNINSVGESNYYRVNIGGNGGTLRASTSGSTDTYGELLNSAGNMLVANDDGGNGTNFSIIRSLSAGTYYVKVRLYSRYRIGSYTLQLNCTGCSDSSSGGTTSGGTTSGGTTSGGTTGGGTTSGGTTGGGTTGGGTTGGGTTGGGTTGGGTTGGGTTSGGTTGNWNVPFLKQHDYAYINEAAAAATSLAMILQYYYPDSAIDPRVVYHSGLQGYFYAFGIASGYRNIRGSTANSSLILDHVPNSGRVYYAGSSAGASRADIDDYLSKTWDINTQTLSNSSAVYSALQSGPVLARVNGPGNGIYSRSHYVVIRGIDTHGSSAVSDDHIIINDPYDTQWANSNTSGNGRRVAYQDFFNNWFVEGIKFEFEDTASQRAHTVIVDTGNISSSGVASIHRFSLSSISAWKFNYLDGDWFFHERTSNNMNATWKPRILRSGRYEISMHVKGHPSANSVVYVVYDRNGNEIERGLGDHRERDRHWLSSTIVREVYLENGASVKASNISPYSSIDALKFKYLGD